MIVLPLPCYPSHFHTKLLILINDHIQIFLCQHHQMYLRVSHCCTVPPIAFILKEYVAVAEV